MLFRKEKRSLIWPYVELTKPRIVLLVLVTTTFGFILGGGGFQSFPLLFYTLLGAMCVCGGSSALNQYLERDVDSQMKRTKHRPLPMGKISPIAAMLYGISLVLLGITILSWKVNLLTAFLSLLTAFLYVLVYTPMKRLTWLNTTIGAIPGAMPPLGGWAAATGEIGLGAWVLFFILFFWQHPHFYAIAWIFREDYAKVGFKMLPVIEPDGRRTFSYIVMSSAFLVPISVLPTFIGMSGKIYLLGATALGVSLLMIGMSLSVSKSIGDARKLLRATVAYLPLLLFLIILDISL